MTHNSDRGGVKQVSTGRITFAVRDTGPEDAPAIVLIHGLAQTLFDWPDAFIEALASQHFRVVSFDNRDVGLSSRFDWMGKPPLIRLWASSTFGLPALARPPYTISDMAADTLELLDKMAIQQAHLVGASMGGMIAQRVALEQPARVSSLTCIMSSSGRSRLPAPRPDVAKQLNSGKSSDNLGDAIEESFAFRQLIGGELTEPDKNELHRRIGRATTHGWPVKLGPARQYAAIMADHARADRLQEIRCPTLVLHGALDPLLPQEHGRDIAIRVPGARLVLFPTMGHEITQSNSNLLANEIISHIETAAGCSRTTVPQSG